MANRGQSPATAAVEQTNLSQRPIKGADGMTGEATAGTEQHVASPTALGLDSTGWVAVAAIVVIALMLWKRVPALIGGMLDARIAAIRTQLEEAGKLRAEAEALRAEYEAKSRSAHEDAEQMRRHAHQEAHAIIVKARLDAEALMARRAKMAEDKIAAAERAAIAEVRLRAADVAARAAGVLIAEHHGAESDHQMVNRAIAGLGRPN